MATVGSWQQEKLLSELFAWAPNVNRPLSPDEQKRLTGNLRRLIEPLSTQMRLVMAALLGLDDAPVSHREAARQMEMLVQDVFRHEQEAIVKLRRQVRECILEEVFQE